MTWLPRFSTGSDNLNSSIRKGRHLFGASPFLFRVFAGLRRPVSTAIRCDCTYMVVANARMTANMPTLAITGSQWRRTNFVVR